MAQRLPTNLGDTDVWGPILTGFLSQGHNADGTHRPFYLASEYGLVGDNSTDNLAAWNALMTTMATNGGIVLMDAPGGVYRHSGALAIAHNNITVLGLGRGGIGTLGPTVFRPTYASGNVFTVTGFNVRLQDFSINASLTRTGGYDVDIATAAVTNPQLINLYCQAPYNGLHVNGIVSTVDNCELRNVVNNAITIDDSNAEVVVSRMLHDASPQAAGGIVVSACGALQIANCDIIHATYDLWLGPAIGQIVSAVYVSNTYFDTAFNGIFIGGAGTVQAVKFVGCWSNGHSDHCILVNNTGASSNDLSFTSCRSNSSTGQNGLQLTQFAGHVEVTGHVGNGNASGSGIGISNASAGNWTINGGHVTGNIDGIFIGSGTFSQAMVCNVNMHGNSGTNFSNGGSGILTANNITT